MRSNADGTVAVNVYGCDPGVVVAVEGHYPHIATETTLGDYAMLPRRLRSAVGVAAYNEFLAARGRVAGYFAAEAAVHLRHRYPAADRVLFCIGRAAPAAPADPDTLVVTELSVYDGAGTLLAPADDPAVGEQGREADERIAGLLAAAAEFGDSRYFPRLDGDDGAPALLVLDELLARPVYDEG